MARPTKLTQAVHEAIVSALETGNYFDTACEHAGIAESTGYSWLARGRAELERRESPRVKVGTAQWDKEQPFVEFVEAVSRVSAAVEMATIATIQRLGQDDWRALAWFMEHRYPKKWGKQVKEVAGADGKPIQVEFIYPDGNASD